MMTHKATWSFRKISLALVLACGAMSASAGTAPATPGKINKVVTDSLNNRFIVELAGAANGCGVPNQFVIYPSDPNYSAVVSTLLTMFTVDRNVQITYATGCAGSYGKILDVVSSK